MAEQQIAYRVKEMVSQQLSVPMERILDNSQLAADLGADSLDTAELLMMVKEEFGYDVPDDELKNIKTFGDLQEIIKSGLSQH